MSSERQLESLAFLTLSSSLLLLADQSLAFLGREWGFTKAAHAHTLNVVTEATGMSWG